MATSEELLEQGYTIAAPASDPGPTPEPTTEVSTVLNTDNLLAQGYTIAEPQSLPGKYGRSLAKGGADLWGMIMQAALPVPPSAGGGPLPLLQRMAGQETPELVMEKVNKAREEVVSDPQYETKTGRVLGATVEALPTAVIPGGGGWLARLATAASGGAGGQIAEEFGQNPLLGSLAGTSIYGLARGGTGALFKSFTKQGREEIAGRTLRQAAGKEGTKNLLTANVDDLASGYVDKAGRPISKTFAEIAKTPGAAKLQKAIGLEMGDEGGQVLDALAARAAARDKSLDDLADDLLKLHPTDRGQKLRGLLVEAQEQADEVVSQAWDPVRLTDIRFDTEGAAKEIAKEATRAGKVVPLSANANRVLAAIDEGAGTLSTEDYQAIRSAAGRVWSLADRSGDSVEARIMGIVREKLDDAAIKAAEQGNIDSQNLTNLRNAIGATRKYKEVFDEGFIGQTLRTRKGEFRKGTAQVARGATATKEAAEEVVTKFGADEEIVKQGRSALVEELAYKKSPSAKLKLLQDKEPQFKAYFDKDYPKVEKFIKDLDSEVEIDRLNQAATGGQSITGQYKTSADFLKNVSIGVKTLKAAGKMASGAGGVGGYAAFGPAGGLLSAVVGGVAGSKLQALAQMQEGQIKELLVSAMAEPAMAKLLMQAPTESTITAILKALPIGGTIGAKGEINDALSADNRASKKASENRPTSIFDIQKKTKAQGPANADPVDDLAFIRKHEGLRLKPYKDTGGVKTIGYGHTGEGVKKVSITKDEAEKLLKKDTETARKAIDQYVDVKLTPEQRAALTSFVFNVGAGNFRNSTLLKKLNKGDYKGAAKEFHRWKYDNGKELAGLVKRRKEEAELFSRSFKV